MTFTAGVIAGTFVQAVVPWALPLTLLPVLLLLRQRDSTPLILITFLTLGIFVSAASLPYANGDTVISRIALESAQKLRALIASIPFKADITAPLLTALLTGDRSGLPAETIAAFRAAGASHILALSGLHMGILYLILDKLTMPIGKSPAAIRIRAALMVTAAAWFTLATGAGPSIVRAFLFILIGEICTVTGRPKRPSRVLCLALMIQLVINPGVIHSLGFQLSYLAMAGIVLIYPVLEKWYPEGPGYNPLRWIWNTAALSISCQLFTGPLVWFRFRTLPKHFLLTNLMAIPLVTVLMAAGVTTIVLYGAGLCPELLIKSTDGLSRLLVWVLEVISS